MVQFSFEICCRWQQETVRAHLDQFPLHRCAPAPAEKQNVEMEPKNCCLHLITKNILHFFSRGDLQMTKILVSKLTESLYE